MTLTGHGETASRERALPGTALDDLLAATCLMIGATCGILHREGSGLLACDAMYPSDLEDGLDALQQVIALRSRAGSPRGSASGRNIVALPIPARSAATMWLALGFAPDDHQGPDRLRLAAPTLSAVIADQVDEQSVVAAAQQRDAALVAALDHADCGVIALRADYSVLFTNSAAGEILASRDGMELRRNAPRPTDYHSAVRFQEALDTVLARSLHRGLAKARAMLLMLERERHQRPLIAVICPAQVGSNTGGEAAIIYVMRPECSVGRGLEPICQLHGLSPVETHLVGHLMAGLTVAEAAAAMRVKPDTARAYLKQVFVKTDTHRQAELLQLLLRYQHAVRGDFAFSAA